MDVARVYFLTMTHWYIVVAVSRVHNADILLDLASSMFFPLHFHVTGLSQRLLILLVILVL